MSVTITVEFAGGLETLFPSKSQKLTLDAREDGSRWNLGQLVTHLVTNLLSGDENMFVLEGKVRPGILVLINEADWELEGEEAYELEEGDSILFVSTLHGG